MLKKKHVEWMGGIHISPALPTEQSAKAGDTVSRLFGSIAISCRNQYGMCRSTILIFLTVFEKALASGEKTTLACRGGKGIIFTTAVPPPKFAHSVISLDMSSSSSSSAAASAAGGDAAAPGEEGILGAFPPPLLPMSKLLFLFVGTLLMSTPSFHHLSIYFSCDTDATAQLARANNTE